MNLSKLNWNAFYHFNNKHKNEIATVCGTGETLGIYKPIENSIHIGCNSAIFYDKIILDYYFFNDCLWGNKELKDKIIAYKPKIQKFIGTFVRDPKFGCPQQFSIKANALWYDLEGPFSGNSGRFHKDIHKYPIGDRGGSTIFFCMQFALFCGFTEINVVGCDIDGNKHFWTKNRKSNLGYLKNNWKAFKLFVNQEFPSVKINIINPIGLKDLFNNIYQ